MQARASGLHAITAPGSRPHLAHCGKAIATTVASSANLKPLTQVEVASGPVSTWALAPLHSTYEMNARKYAGMQRIFPRTEELRKR
jgi:hypothetical protein